MKAPRWRRPPVRWDKDTVRTWRKHATAGDADRALMTEESRARLDAMAAARFAAYVDARRLGQTHAAAVRASNRTVRKVARALGYSYPAAHELTF